MKKLVTTICILSLFMAIETANAGHFSFGNQSMLEFTLSARDYNSNLNDFGYSNRNSFDNAKFSIGVNHWTTNYSAMTFSIAALDVSDKTYLREYGIAGTQSSIVPMFFGSRFYMTDINGAMPINPYFAISGGPVLGVNNYKDYGDVVYFEDDVYLTVGGYLGGGVDMKFGQRTFIGLQAGYNFYADFAEYIGDRKNFSGAEVGLSLGILFGSDNSKSSHKKHKRKKRVRKF